MSLQGRNVLVTGATGFLGGALTLRLAGAGARVRALARHPEKGAFLRDVQGVEMVQGNITEAEQLRDPFAGCDLVFHVAASTGGSLEKQRRNNVLGTRNVAEAAAHANVKRLVHVSTIAVYGYRLNGDVSENMPHNPGHDPYNITKSEAERMLREMASSHSLAYSIIRPGMIYGPGSNMWTKSLFKLAKRRPTPFVGHGNGSSFPIYVDDVTDMMVVLATHPAAVGETFHCTPDPSPTWREFLGAYARLAGHQKWLSLPPFVFKGFATIVSTFAKPHTQAKVLPDLLFMSQQRLTFKMTKAHDLLNWTPSVDLETGIQKCTPWLRAEGLLDE
jgi:nucleoside-diphosphate-sugar epimerase